MALLQYFFFFDNLSRSKFLIICHTDSWDPFLPLEMTIFALLLYLAVCVLASSSFLPSITIVIKSVHESVHWNLDEGKDKQQKNLKATDVKNSREPVNLENISLGGDSDKKIAFDSHAVILSEKGIVVMPN